MPGDPARLDIQVVDQLARELGHETVALFAFCEGLLPSLPLGDVPKLGHPNGSTVVGDVLSPDLEGIDGAVLTEALCIIGRLLADEDILHDQIP